MTEKYMQLLEKLRAVIVARVSRVVAEDKNLVSFESVDGLTIWCNEPSAHAERQRFGRNKWESTRRSYTHYFGFGAYAASGGSEGQVYFQMNDYVEADYFGIGKVSHLDLNPPRQNDWVIGEYTLVSGKGLRFKSWNHISKFEVYIREALLNGHGIHEATIREMEESKMAGHNRLANFARLVVNNQIGYYLAMKRSASKLNPAEWYLQRCKVDSIVFAIRDLRPDLWEKYKEASLGEKMYSSMIPEPAPTPIDDNLDGMAETVGLNTPFKDLKLA
jgi:hypothetical protein